MPNLGDIFPNFECTSTRGTLRCHDYIGDGWALFLSHPGDFTPVCTSELGTLAARYDEFEKRNCKIICLSCDPVDRHLEWEKDVMAQAGLDGDELPFPIIADEKRELSVRLGILDDDFKDGFGIPLSARGTFLIDPDRHIKFIATYPGPLGRTCDELLRIIDGLQLIEYRRVCIPMDWQYGQEVMTRPDVTPEEFGTVYPKGVSVQEMPSGKEYMYFTPQPEL
ncbi:uncharacterized protein MONBRDRAFT_32821 [Monosiga brevicollis MX1]|uniref:Thioredoxin domain-containing protein n=1 Tax=Monosiga brevicollis TaxID=81824 RepID=A9V1X1_MONBE|nr:uncharacterized protein MONBRDRAFT_32821 [Monosiga brevicollis MX1]EDQ88637.1 predicted protein [Monosiga brevicollis MX1]|eukprot:XP_001746741.1 hypothetical protein [Monosiga brevicollis MX1]